MSFITEIECDTAACDEAMDVTDLDWSQANDIAISKGWSAEDDIHFCPTCTARLEQRTIDYSNNT